MQWRWIAGLTVLLVAAHAWGAGDTIPVKGADGGSYGVLVFCNDCRSEGMKGPCHTGADAGWYNGKPCGTCMVEANHDVILRYPVDIHITGKLVTASGKPIKERFIKLFLPNGWGVRTRTQEDGTFRMMLGATAERESKSPLVIDVGTRTDSEKKGTDPHYAMFFMPESYKPCAENQKPAAPAGKRAKDKSL